MEEENLISEAHLHAGDENSEFYVDSEGCDHSSNISQETEVIGTNQPNGGRIVYFCFALLGLGSLLPWNIFINADSYWQFKLRNTSESDIDWNRRNTTLQKFFDPFLVSFSQSTNFTFLIINMLCAQLLPREFILLVSLFTMTFLFTCTSVLSEVNTDDWQLTFFVLTMLIVIVLNGAQASFVSTLFGVLGTFPRRFTNAAGIGMALGGIFASIARIVSLYVGFDDVTSAFIYFCIAVACMLIILLDFVLVTRTKFYKHYSPDYMLVNEPKRRIGFVELVRNQGQVFSEIWHVATGVCFVFCVTLIVYPSVCVKIKSTSHDKVWAEKYFHPVITFLLFNSGDCLGRVFAEFLLWPVRWIKSLCVLSLFRTILIPMILMCPHSQTSHMPTLFHHDAFYIAFMTVFSVSNGYIISVFLMHAPKIVPLRHSEKAAQIMATMIGLGLLLGSFFSFALALLF